MIRARETAPYLHHEEPRYKRAIVSAADRKAADEELARELRELARKNDLRRSHPTKGEIR